MEAMDFMDPRQRTRHSIMVAIGYVLVGIALLLLTTILLSVAYGFGLKDGRVTFNGLLFVSSTPSSAQIYIDGSQYGSNTNTKLYLAEGTYRFDLRRAGYRTWSRSITVEGGDVESYTYPFLFPDDLTTNTIHAYSAAPSFVTESADRHWLLVAQAGSQTAYDEYDLTDAKKAPVVVTLPAALVTPGASQTYETVAWADDNSHLLVRHTYDGKAEYVLINRTSPDQSVNLSKMYNLPTADIDVRLSNGRPDRFVILNGATHDLSRATLGTPTLAPYLPNVLAFAPYGDNTVLYVTPDPAAAQKVLVELYDNGTTYTIRHAAASATYLLDIANYSGDVYVATAAASEDFAYVYKNPETQIANQQLGVAVPVQVLSIKSPTYTAFSPNGQYALFESANRLVSYDAENDQGFSYALNDPVDAPQKHVSWMDGARLAYVSKGQVVVFDYDGQNRQVLVSADPHFGPTFDSSYKFLYDFVPSAGNTSQELLTSTSLRTPADQ